MKYITTAIPYANAAPHIGTAMDYLYADVLARSTGSILQVGTDEHGTKIEQKAAELGKTSQDFVDSLQLEFEKMRDILNVDRTNLINVRTTDDFHVRRVQIIWQKLADAGVIYPGTYDGWYCVGCEEFKTQNEYDENDGMCPIHKKPLEKVSEENYYLKTSAFTEKLREFISATVVPEFRGKEILELIKNGASDVSISRPKSQLSWGIPVPGDDTQVMYVWVDALSNYLTVLDQDLDDETWFANLQSGKTWPAEVEIIGKDILRFHTIIWGTILLSLELPLPKKLFVHGFLTVDGEKMSKSIGNIVSPTEVVEKYGADAFRYYFIRHIPTFDDGDFTWGKFEKAYNGELANDLGNLVSRLANMLMKYEITNLNRPKFNTELDDFNDLDLSKKLNTIWLEKVQSLNKTIEENKPWELAKTDPEKLEKVLLKLWNNILLAAYELKPFIPQTADKIIEIFDVEKITERPEILFTKF